VILLSDANVLMDMGHVSGLPALTAIAPVEVLDVILQECHHKSQPGLVEAIRTAGIKEVTADHDLLVKAAHYQETHIRLSLEDAMCLHYAKKYKRLLLTNEKSLRASCDEQSVEVHGTIWIIERAHEKKLHNKKELCRWLTILSSPERRLPPGELLRLKHIFGCPS
jgi:PIN domain nuclease of toxin-antitoxin system